MARAADILIILTYAMIAVIAAVTFDRLGLMSSELAWMMGAIVFLIAGQVHSAAARAHERAETSRLIAELQSAQLGLAEEIESLQTRLDAAERAGPQADPRRPEDAPDARRLAELVRAMEAAGATETAIAEAAPGEARTSAEPARRPARAAPTAERIEAVIDAVASSRVDLYLQPVVGLPQRRTYFYEAFTRLRDADGAVVEPADFLEAAEAGGVMGEIDSLVLLRCTQILRRLAKSDRRVGVFCTLSARALADEESLPDFLEFLRRNADLAGSLIFEISQEEFEARSAVAARAIARIADYGFRFSLDKVTRLDMDLSELQRAGVRFAKVDGARLIAAARGFEPVAGRPAGAIRPDDIAALFARYGVDLIAEKVESEAVVVEILDLDVAYGQGFLFGAPRPVREAVLAEEDEDARRAG